MKPKLFMNITRPHLFIDSNSGYLPSGPRDSHVNSRNMWAKNVL